MFDPRGGYFKAGGVYMPSIVAEIGCVVENHLKMIGLLHDPEMSAEQRHLIAEKRALYDARAKKKSSLSAATDEATSDNPSDAPSRRTPGPSASAAHGGDASTPEEASDFPPGATMCHKCNTNAVIVMDGCATCLNCGYSKCG